MPGTKEPMTPERLGEIRKRIASARSSNPKNQIPEHGDLRLLKEALDEIERCWGEIEAHKKTIERQASLVKRAIRNEVDMADRLLERADN